MCCLLSFIRMSSTCRHILLARIYSDIFHTFYIILSCNIITSYGSYIGIEATRIYSDIFSTFYVSCNTITLNRTNIYELYVYIIIMYATGRYCYNRSKVLLKDNSGRATARVEIWLCCFHSSVWGTSQWSTQRRESSARGETWWVHCIYLKFNLVFC